MKTLLPLFDAHGLRGGPSPENVRKAEEIRRRFRFCAVAPVPSMRVAPQAGAPQAGAPQAGAPEARAPEARAPEAGAPKARAPQLAAQNWSCRKCNHSFGLRRTRDLHEARCGS